MAHSKSGKRDTNDVTSDPLLALTQLPSRPVSTMMPTYQLAYELQSLQEVEDRRQWTPSETLRPLLTAAGRRAVQSTRNQFDFTRPLRTVYGVMSSPDPMRTAIVCARRKARREIMHALKLKRKGRGGGYRPRSKIKC